MPGRLTYSVSLRILHYIKLLLCAELDVLATFTLKAYNSELQQQSIQQGMHNIYTGKMELVAGMAIAQLYIHISQEIQTVIG